MQRTCLTAMRIMKKQFITHDCRTKEQSRSNSDGYFDMKH
jgi:hypothetical protein